MKFVFISTMHGAPWGGSEELWSRAASQLKQAGHKVYASVRHWPRMSDKVTALSKQGISFRLHPSDKDQLARRILNKLLRRNQRAYNWLKRTKPDLVVISQGDNGGGFGWANACREAGIPYVIVVHCNYELWWFGEQLPLAGASYSGARKVFCVSQGNLDLLRLQLGNELSNAELISSPCNILAEEPPPWPDTTKALRLACVARLEVKAKGQDLLLQVLAQPNWRNRAVELSLFGAGGDDVVLRNLVQILKLKNVHFQGQVNDIRSIWAQNHMLVLPSRYEGLPLTLVEAMWCARPSVVTDVGGSAELCADGITGFVAPSASIDSLAMTLEKAWERRQEWLSMGQAARARVEQRVPKDPVKPFCDRLLSLASV